MKQFYKLTLSIISLIFTQQIQAQCNGVKGPNLLGAKGTFSTPFITVNNSAASCTRNGSNSYNPIGNVGNSISSCTNTTGSYVPCSDYTYTSANGGLGPEARYSILKTIGNSEGGNCIKGDWRASDHTGDGGYFMAVNGAPNTSTSGTFYRIKNIPVCIGATYEFSAWVINLLPGTSPAAVAGSEPNISFKVNGTVIGNSGAIAYNTTPIWVKVGGSFVATTSTVDLEVVNATAVATGNDLGLDDISINLCGSQIEVSTPAPFCEGQNVTVNFTVTDATAHNSWYQWQKSTNGGASFTNDGSPAQATFTGTSYTITKNIGAALMSMNGYKYRLVVATSAAGLSTPDCGFFNEYTLVVPACSPTPVTMVSFTGKYSNGVSTLNWETSMEWNSDRFEIMRSSDGINFTTVGAVPGAINSALARKYQFVDKYSGQGYVYYRLRLVDLDGKSKNSNIIRLNMGNVKQSFEMYPNPFKSDFTASFSADKTSDATFKIINMSGQIVYHTQIKVTKGYNAVQLNRLPNIPAGLYYVTINNDELNYNGKIQKVQ